MDRCAVRCLSSVPLTVYTLNLAAGLLRRAKYEKTGFAKIEKQQAGGLLLQQASID